MCQPKPGPRCAAHARSVLTATRAAASTAQSAAERASAATAYEQALRDYETTPEGQKALTEAADRLAREGDVRGAEDAQRRLDQAKTIRARQVANLEASREQRDRLVNATPDEAAAMEDADAPVPAATRTLAEAERLAAEASREFDEHEPVYATAEKEYRTAEDAMYRTHDPVGVTQRAAAQEAYRLYTEAGIASRTAWSYVKDTEKMAAGPTQDQRATVGGKAVAQQPLVLRTKRSGPDRDKTLASKLAAETDEKFQRWNTRLAEAIPAYQEAHAGLERASTTYQAALERYHSLKRRAEQSQMAVEDARTAHTTVAGRAARLRAHIAAGLGTQSESVDLSQARDQIVRQPDGSTNAYVYRAPSDGFPHGRYMRVTGVTQAHGSSSPANALVLQDGTRVHETVHSYRDHRGYHSRPDTPTGIIITPAHPGARPLRRESLPSAGFSLVIDSTD